MTASEASANRTKKPAAAVSVDKKVVTFRLKQLHRDALARYAVELASKQKKPVRVSKNLAVQHMIMNARVVRGEKVETRMDEDGTAQKVSTFRLDEVHRDRLTSYAVELAAQQNPVRQVSNNEALQHLMLHARVRSTKLNVNAALAETGS